MGARAVPHLPCSFSCRSTVDFANPLMALGRELGFAAEMEWLEEILNWPASWSALHGIAQVKTPVLKVSTRTDATAHEFVVRRPGARMPDEAAAGLVFPFRTPERPGLTHSLAFRRGLEAPIAPLHRAPELVCDRQRLQLARGDGRSAPADRRAGARRRSATPARCSISAAATARC